MLHCVSQKKNLYPFKQKNSSSCLLAQTSVCVTFCDLISRLHNVKIIRLTGKPETGDFKRKITTQDYHDLFTPKNILVLCLNFIKDSNMYYLRF